MSAVRGLLDAKFIVEVRYIEWLSNVVLVKKSLEKWRVCMQYIGLNRAWYKDSYPLPNIYNLMVNSSDHKLLSFIDMYYGYNHIPRF